MLKILPQEAIFIEKIKKNNPNLGELIDANIKKIPTETSAVMAVMFDKQYDSALVREFLIVLIETSQKEILEEYFTAHTRDEIGHMIKKKCSAPNELEENLFRTLGSGGYTNLISNLLTKMSQSEFSTPEIETLTSLIEARNTLRNAEKTFLEKTFAVYLEKKLALYS